LLIDDDIELVDMLKEYLEQDGFDVSAVHNGVDGLAQAASGAYAIAVLDVMMPRMQGLETLRQLRTRSQLPVLMLTARGDDADRILGLELRAPTITSPSRARRASCPRASGQSCAVPSSRKGRPATARSSSWAGWRCGRSSAACSGTARRWP
jgi:CheY-like chemotaxis protein